MTCKYASEYYLRLLCVPLCTVAPSKPRHIIIVINGIQSRSYNANSLFIHSRKLKFQSRFRRKTQLCFVCLFFQSLGFFSRLLQLRARIICLFSPNPSSCVFGAWFKIEILIATHMHKFLFMFCAIFLSAFTQIVLLNSMPIFSLSFSLSATFSHNICHRKTQNHWVTLRQC